MASRETAPSPALQEATLRLWRAYEYLHANDLTPVSTTSRLLRSPDLAYLGFRLADELQELAGVLTGEHRHSSPDVDLVLEGSQVCYWTYLCALALKLTYEDLNPAYQLATTGSEDVSRLPEGIRSVARDAKELTGDTERGMQVRLLERALQAVGGGLASRGVDALDVVAYDLRQMSGRPYMQAHFKTQG